MISKFHIPVTLFIGFIILVSCSRGKTELRTSFACHEALDLQDLESVSDFNNNFTIQVPKYWNTKLYYDKKQSEIFSADTLKNLRDTYIMDFSAVYSSLKIDKNLQENVRRTTMNNDLAFVKDSFHKFQGYDAYAQLSKGKSKDIDLYVFQYYIAIHPEKYLLIKTEFYGEDNFNQRFCEALALIEKIKIRNP